MLFWIGACLILVVFYSLLGLRRRGGGAGRRAQSGGLDGGRRRGRPGRHAPQPGRLIFFRLDVVISPIHHAPFDSFFFILLLICLSSKNRRVFVVFFLFFSRGVLGFLFVLDDSWGQAWDGGPVAAVSN